MKREDIVQIFRLAPMQEGMLFDSLRGLPGDLVCQYALRLDGRLDVSVLREAWQNVLDRHGILRASLHYENVDAAVNIVWRQPSIPWHISDWRQHSPARQAELLAQHREQDRAAGVSLDRPPLMRMHLLQLGDDRHQMVWTFHHILLDGWSVMSVLADVFAAYRAIAAGEVISWAPVRPFWDFVGWLGKQDLQAARRFWTAQLAGYSSAAASGLSGAGTAEAGIDLPSNARRAIDRLSQDTGVTASTIVHGVWALLLAQLSRRDDVAFGTVVSGRPASLSGSTEMVGIFLNVLPVRVRVPADAILLDWLVQLQQSIVAARDYEYVTLSEIQRWAQTGPLIDALLGFQNYPHRPGWEDAGGLQVADLTATESPQFPLQLTVRDSDTINLRLGYDVGQFSADRIGQILGHLQQLLEFIAMKPGKAIGDLPVLEYVAATPALTAIVSGPETPGASAPAAVEEIVTSVWAETLKVTTPARDDNFLESGGHSVMAIQLMSRLRAIFAVPFELIDLFSHPTIAGITATLAARLRHHSIDDTASIAVTDRNAPLRPSFSQERLWFLDQISPDRASYNVPLAVRLTGELNIPALKASLAGIIARHEVLRTSFAESDGSVLQVIADHVPLPWQETDLRQHAEPAKEASRLLDAASGISFDLTKAPLVRFHVIRLSDDDFVFAMCFHHAITDAWSISIFCAELNAGYRAAHTARPIPTGSGAIQYADFAAWQRDALTEGVGELESYWRERLSGAPPITTVAPDIDSAQGAQGRGKVCRSRLASHLTQTLRQTAHRQHVTLYMALLTAFGSTLSRFSGQTDLVIAAPVAGRERPELDQVMGFFINTLPMRLTCDPQSTYTDLLALARESCLGALAHQTLPFDRIVAAVNPRRQADQQPLTQVALNLLNAPGEDISLPAVTTGEWEIASEIARYDLHLEAYESTDGTLELALRYATGRYSPQLAQRFLAALTDTLSRIALSPEGKAFGANVSATEGQSLRAASRARLLASS